MNLSSVKYPSRDWVTSFRMNFILESMAPILVSVWIGYKSPTSMLASMRKRYIMSLIPKSSDVTVFPRRKRSSYKISKFQHWLNIVKLSLNLYNVHKISIDEHVSSWQWISDGFHYEMNYNRTHNIFLDCFNNCNYHVLTTEIWMTVCWKCMFPWNGKLISLSLSSTNSSLLIISIKKDKPWSMFYLYL